MPKTVPIQDNFSAGEITPKYLAQLNAEAYKNGVGTLENWITYPQGPVYRRNGFRYHAQIDGTYGRLIKFPITSQFVAFVIITDQNKLYVANTDGLLLASGNVVSNPNFLNGSTNWTDASSGSGYIIFGVGSATLHPGEENPGLNNEATLKQTLTLGSGVVDHTVSIESAPQTILAEVRVRIGSSDGAGDLLDEVVSGSITHFVQTFDPNGNTTVYLNIMATETDEGYTRTLTAVQVYDAASLVEVEFTTPWSGDELEYIQVGYPPGVDELYFVAPSDAPQVLSFTRATGVWSFGAITFTSAPAAWASGNYPSAITFFQGRSWWAGCPDNPETFWASRSGLYTNLDVGTGLASHALEFVMAERGAIRWLVGAKNLLVGTEFGEYIITAEGGLIYAGDIQVDQQSAYGSAPIQPVQIGNRVLYVSPDRRKIRDMGYKWTDDGWISRDISFASEHITQGNPIAQMAFAQNPGNLLFCVSRNYNLLGATYERGNDIVGWFRCVTDGRVMAAASVDLEGTSTLAILVNRNIQSTPTLYFEVCYPAGDPSVNACVVDSGEVFGGVGGSISEVSVPHLKNKTVSVIVDGALHPDVDLDSNGDGTLQIAGETVVVGLPYTATMETLPLASLVASSQSSLPMKKRYNKIFVRLFDSAIPKINGTRPPTRYPATPMDQREAAFTGDVKVTNLGWTQDSAIQIVQDLPLHTRIAGIFGEAQQEMLG